jgi:multidrug efflux pump subunit AcrB
MHKAIVGNFRDATQAIQASLERRPCSILATFASVCLLCGLLHDGYIHPLAILSLLPTSGMGPLLMRHLLQFDLSISALVATVKRYGRQMEQRVSA